MVSDVWIALAPGRFTHKETLRAWLSAMLSTPATFHIMKKDLDWEIEQRRETQKVNATLARTTVQRIWDVNTRRQALGGKVDKEQLFKMYELNLTLSGRSEPLTMTFIERAIFIWEKGRALQIQRMHVRAKWCFLGMGME